LKDNPQNAERRLLVTKLNIAQRKEVKQIAVFQDLFPLKERELFS
jgi:hypothetical protein